MKLIFLAIVILTLSSLISSEVTDTECSCGFMIIVFCPGFIQCTRACWDYTGISM